MFGEFRVSLLKTLSCYLRGKPIVMGRAFHVAGLAGMTFIDKESQLRLGLRPYGFADPKQRAIIRNRGRVIIGGKVAIGVGSQLDVGPDATLTIGRGTYLSPGVRIVVSKGLTLGQDCAIGWNVQFLDDNFHGFGTAGSEWPPSAQEIVLGEHVWVGSHALIYRGVIIADGCIVAGGAVVTQSVSDPNCLIAGNPAVVVRRGVSWS